MKDLILATPFNADISIYCSLRVELFKLVVIHSSFFSWKERGILKTQIWPEVIAIDLKIKFW